MKLGCYTHDTGYGLCAWLGDTVIDVSALGGERWAGLTWRDVLAKDPELITVRRLLDAWKPGSCVMDIEKMQFAAPVPDARLSLGIGLNYRAHCMEQGKPLPAKPIVFGIAPGALTGHLRAVSGKGFTRELDYEGELALVIGRRASRVPVDQAMQYVAGYTIMNDITARDLQRAEGQWTRAKGADGFAPCGPWLVTTDEIPDHSALTIVTRVNGDERQRASVSDLIFSIPELIEHITEAITLEPGDIITTGTPSGVGEHRRPPSFLQPGDRVEVTIDPIGTLVTPII